MAAFIDLEPGAVLLIGDARVELVSKRGSKARLKVDAPQSVKLATQTKPTLTKPHQPEQSRKSATELK